MESLKLGLQPLSLLDVYDVAVRGKSVVLSEVAVHKVQAAHEFLASKVKEGDVLYGVNTGFGLLSNVKIPSKDIETLQYNLLRSHACGIGSPISDHQVRAMLLLRASNLALGH